MFKKRLYSAPRVRCTSPLVETFSNYRYKTSPFNAVGSSFTLEHGSSTRKHPSSADSAPKRQKKPPPKENAVSEKNLNKFNKYKNLYIKPTDSDLKPEIISCFKYPPMFNFEDLHATSYLLKKEQQQHRQSFSTNSMTENKGGYSSFF
ncbi:hypothetical protein K501DRAFT_276267 [Backusella circina FSU 941]|nr:hypothetical protein K501DRAFT_276267 [Backusella circina FSU 941]